MNYHFPVDVCLRRGAKEDGTAQSWLQELVTEVLWRGFLPYLLPWKIRVAVWNWMWSYSGDKKVSE